MNLKFDQGQDQGYHAHLERFHLVSERSQCYRPERHQLPPFIPVTNTLLYAIVFMYVTTIHTLNMIRQEQTGKYNFQFDLFNDTVTRKLGQRHPAKLDTMNVTTHWRLSSQTH